MFSKLRWMREKFASAMQDPFRDVVFDERKFSRAMSWPEPAKRYVIFFTPRSGSSRLTDLAVRTKALGHPGECFNPAFVPEIAQAYSARNIDEYLALLLRYRQTKGVFGCEITMNHLIANFKSGQAFLDAVQPTSVLWLIREDIVSQAVSLMRMKQTKVSHSVSTDADVMARAEAQFAYDPKVIRNALPRMRWLESETEKVIALSGLTPKRLSYERTIAMRPRRLMAQIGVHVGVPPRHMELDELDSGHKKVSGVKSDEFAQRFREEHPDLVAQIEEERAPMLAALDEAPAPRDKPTSPS